MKIIKLSLFGPSGSGKTTSEKIIKQIVKEKYDNHKVISVNVAQPLHEIQKFAYKKFDLVNGGQDGVLLQFLANHFENYLGKACVKRIKSKIKLHSEKGNLIFLNSDCRNNAYQDLKQEGFLFIRIFTQPRLIKKRLRKRQDITYFDPEKGIEQINKIKQNYFVNNSGSIQKLKDNLKRLLKQIT